MCFSFFVLVVAFWARHEHADMSFAKTMYEAVFRRNSTHMVFVLTGCFVFERIFNPVTDGYFKSRNAGVRSVLRALCVCRCACVSVCVCVCLLCVCVCVFSVCVCLLCVCVWQPLSRLLSTSTSFCVPKNAHTVECALVSLFLLDPLFWRSRSCTQTSHAPRRSKSQASAASRLY